MKSTSEKTVAGGPAAQPAEIPLYRRILQRQEFGVFLALILISIFFSVSTTTFLTMPNMLNVMRQISINGIIVMAMTFVIIIKDIDLSIGSTFALVSMLVAIMFNTYGVNIWLASLIGLILGGILGLINGVVAVKGQLPPFIVTLGSMMIYRGLALVISGGVPAAVRLPETFFMFTGARVFGRIPVPSLWFLGVTLIAGFILHRTSYGFKVYAVGGNAEAARLAGIDVDRVRITNFVILGVVSGLAGIISMSYLSSVTPTVGQGIEMQVIAATVLGGTSMLGGVGTILGSFLGTLVLGVVRNGLVLMGTSAYLIDLITGIVLILAVFVSSYAHREKR
ncbi:MAG TPA: ABC transporter permease [Firmicutes bacterium]|nr:ABC transporter permease [Bacillota bacterium]